MNPLKSIYCNQYQELRKKGKEETARKNGTILSAVCLILIAFGIFLFLMTFLPDFEKDLSRSIRRTFGRNSGKFVGQVFALLLFGIFYFGTKFTLGSKRSYDKNIVTFLSLPKAEQESISKKGLYFFVSTIIFMVLSLFAMMIKTFAF